MSQGGPLRSSGSGSGSPVETITGNSGGPVPPDAAFNLNFVGNTTMGVTVVGNPGLSTLTIVPSQATTTQFGVIKTATNALTIAGTDTNNAVTSASLASKLGTQTLHGLPIGQGTSTAFNWTAAPTNGQLLIGNSGSDPVLSTLTAGAGIGIANGSGTITITNTGGSGFAYTAVNTTPYVVLPADQFLGVDCSGSAITIQLPNAPSTGRIIVVKDSTGSSLANPITVTTVGGVVNIDGATTYVIQSAYQSIQVLFNGASYEVF